MIGDCCAACNAKEVVLHVGGICGSCMRAGWFPCGYCGAMANLADRRHCEAENHLHNWCVDCAMESSTEVCPESDEARLARELAA